MMRYLAGTNFTSVKLTSILYQILSTNWHDVPLNVILWEDNTTYAVFLPKKHNLNVITNKHQTSPVYKKNKSVSSKTEMSWKTVPDYRRRKKWQLNAEGSLGLDSDLGKENTWRELLDNQENIIQTISSPCSNFPVYQKNNFCTCFVWIIVHFLISIFVI